jgi:transposase
LGSRERPLSRFERLTNSRPPALPGDGYSVVLLEKPENFGIDKLFWTCPLLAELLEQTYGVKVGASTIYNHLKELDLSYQKPHYQAKEMDPDEVSTFTQSR